MSVETVDAVVVGAGPNGLVAANLLADAGWSVLVLEGADEPGGAVRSGQITAAGYVSDLGSAFYPLGAASPVLAGLGLHRHGLAWTHAPLALAHVLADDRCVVLSRDIDQTLASVSAFAAGDGPAWQALSAQWQRIRDDLLDAILSPFPPMRAGARLLRATGTAEALRLARMATVPVRRLGAELFSGEGARLLLTGNALHSDLGPDHAGSGLFGWLLAMLGQEVGFPAPAGGAGRITAALVRRLGERGGRVHCGRTVRRVLIARGRAMGVQDEHGELVRARRAVLADTPAPHLYHDLVGHEHLPARLVADLARFQWDDATVKVDWALSGGIPWTAEQVRRAGVVHLDLDVDGMAAFSGDLASGRVPERPFLLLGQMTTTDPARSPPGTESVWAYTHVPRGLRWGSDDLHRFADRIEQVVERRAPGFTWRIVARAVHGPHDLQRTNPSLVEGAVNAGTAAIHQQLIFRPVPGLGRADTPVDRLYLAGASAHPGGAVHGGPGANAARAALARNGMAGAGYAAVVRAGHRLVYG